MKAAYVSLSKNYLPHILGLYFRVLIYLSAFKLECLGHGKVPVFPEWTEIVNENPWLVGQTWWVGG